ncbi:transglutaminase TgpA family protein [Plantactinospora sp. CA-290183]|uniref:transglutaminase TgpA family protein n=1 Tax=Plantactinospora sp. CA-290183 TaxID=3240006 RepID=UPI003D8A9375
MRRLVSTTCTVLAAVVAGLLFGTVFGVPGLLVPVGVPAVVVLLAALACTGRPALESWRPLLATGAGLLAVVETSLWSTTLAGLPTGRTLRALGAGITDSWQLTLQSTWPARPDPALLLFVPLLVVLAAVLGIELLRRPGGALPALAPSLAVAVLSQFYAPLTPGVGAAAALAYAAVAGTLLASGRSVPDDAVTPAGRGPTGGSPARAGAVARGAVERSGALSVLPQLVPPAVLGLVAALLAGLLLPTAPARYSLRHDQAAPLPDTRLTSPLDEIAYRLASPTAPVFRVRAADAEVDRWPLVVLDTFDGVNWTSGGRYLRMGAELRPSAAVTVNVRRRSAEIEATGTGGPWLPSQTWPAGVSGIEPLVEEGHGSLLLPGSEGVARYTLSWWQPQVDAEALSSAAIDPRAPGGFGGLGEVPAGMAELAEEAVRGGRPTFQTALVLERFLRQNYRLATGNDLPTGHSWPQVADFLLRGKRGTSEQFAAAYVVLARMRSIPARLAVGFRTPAARDADGGYTVRNADVLAWPEVAVAGVGWVPLDPSGTASAGSTAAGGGLAALTAQVRDRLPATDELRDPPVAPPTRASDGGGPALDLGTPQWTLLLGLPVLLLAGWLLGVPATRAGRTWRRRRRPGPGAVVGAWEEVRDRLRGHGVPVSAGMTVRDLAAEAGPVTGPGTAEELRRLGAVVDRALWSGAAPTGEDVRQAWDTVRAVRRGLARRGWRARLRALFDPRTLRPPQR